MYSIIWHGHVLLSVKKHSNRQDWTQGFASEGQSDIFTSAVMSRWQSVVLWMDTQACWTLKAVLFQCQGLPHDSVHCRAPLALLAVPGLFRPNWGREGKKTIAVTAFAAWRQPKYNAFLSIQTSVKRPQHTPFPDSKIPTHIQSHWPCSEQKFWTRWSPEVPSYLSYSMIPEMGQMSMLSISSLICQDISIWKNLRMSKWRRSWGEGRWKWNVWIERSTNKKDMWNKRAG